MSEDLKFRPFEAREGTGTLKSQSSHSGSERRPAFRLAHLLVRSFCVINITYMWADSIYKPLEPWLANGLLGSVLIWWAIRSIVLLPVFVGVEAFWMRSYLAEPRSLLIDLVFVATRFVAFWMGLWYALAHYAIL